MPEYDGDRWSALASLIKAAGNGTTADRLRALASLQLQIANEVAQILVIAADGADAESEEHTAS
jgi:hypothetical protein